MGKMIDSNGFKLSVEFSQVEKYLKDLEELEPKTRKQIIRSTLRKANKELLSSEKAELKDIALGQGKLSKWKRHHTGQLKRGITGKVKVNNRKMMVVTGVRNRDKGFTSYIKAPMYGGVWQNFGTRDHRIGKGSNLRAKRRVQTGGMVRGIKGNDWVVKSWKKVEKNVIKNIENDLEMAYNDTVKSKY